MCSFFNYPRTALLLFLLSTTNIIGQNHIDLKDIFSLQDIGKNTHYYEDDSNGLSIDDIRSLDVQNKFVPYQQDAINFSSTSSTYWLKFVVNQNVSERFYVNIGSSYIDKISLFEFDEDTMVSERHTGDDLPFDSREIKVGNYLFAMPMEMGMKRTYYLKVKSDQPLFFLLKVGTLASFSEYEHDLDFLQGIYFGVMLLIFLYNLFLYFSTKEQIYLYYIAYVLSMTCFMASVFGYFFEYFWPNAPIINQLAVVTSGLTMITATLFTQKFLNTKESEPLMHKISMLFLGVGLAVGVFVITGLRIEGLILAQGGLLLMAAYFLALGIRFKIRGFSPAKFYLLAWGALIVGIVFAILESLNVIPVMSYLNAMQIGSGLEVVLLSFALGDRINMYKKQKEDAQYKALTTAKENERLIQEQNIILEKKVEERTQEVAQQNKKLVHLNKEKDMLVNVVAHDLRTPLSHIRLLIQLINMTAVNLSKDQESYLEEIDHSTDRLSKLIARILDIHALETNRVELNTQIVDLEELVSYVVNCFRLTSKNKEIEINILCEQGDHFVEVDKNYMIQVLENLISNALKFSERGSQVFVHVKSDQGQSYVVVEDQGPGINEEDQKKLFGKFQKLSAQPTEGEASIGLGLSIVKKYIECMKGEIHCESEVGVGTKFIVSFNSVKHQSKIS